ALYLAYISLFEAEEGVPEHPDIMLGYMHKAMALLLANPQLLDKIDSKNVSTLPSQFTLERYAVWQYLYDGGEIDWTKKAPEGEGYTIAGESYQTWNIKLKKAIWNRGDAFLTNIGKQQFIHDAIDYSQFPVIACTARRKGWHLTLPADYREQNFRGGGRFDWASCRAVE
ncbi:transcriptional regulator, partial [Klebsiella pneumoniae]|nr:transcriptional regulator [Klebsiella pneumoniae]